MKIRKLQIATMAGALGLALQAQATMYNITYTETYDVGSYPPFGTTATGTIDVEAGVAVSGSLFVNNAFPAGLSGQYLTLVTGAGINGSSQFSYDNLVNTASPGGQFLNNNPPSNPSGGLLFMNGAGDQMNLWYNVAAINYPFATPPNVNQPAGSYSLWGWEFGAGQNNDYTQTYGIATLAPVPEPTTMVAGALLLLPFGASTIRFLRKRQTA